MKRILMTIACTIAFACMYAQTIYVYQDGIYTKSYDSSNTDMVTMSANSVTFQRGMKTTTYSGNSISKLGIGDTPQPRPLTPRAIDLGLSVMWSYCNIGATDSNDYGYYFAWGEIEPKNSYEWNCYQWCNGTYKVITKYNMDSSQETYDGKATLSQYDDAAQQIWGGDWRMPTKEEFQELVDKCTWTYGFGGYRITGPNGNSIWLPFSGFRKGEIVFAEDGKIESGTNSQGTEGYLWATAVNESNPMYASAFTYRKYNNITQSYVFDNMTRKDGLAIRPVCPVKDRPSISVNHTELNLLYANSSQTINVISDLSWTVTKSDSWIRVDKTSGTGNGTLTVSVTENTSRSSRTGTVTITASDGNKVVLDVYQSASPFEPHEYVDLGLSVRWATENIGADKIKVGDYFAWGEIMAKDNYSSNTYVPDHSYIENNYSKGGTLEKGMDAASQNWGGAWRMPTEKEFWELITNCSWTFTNQNGKDGFLVESQVKGYEGRSIFLPCTGYRDSYSLEGAKTSCYYWSSTYNGSSPYCLCAKNGWKPEAIEYYQSRGCAIRPVCP